MKNTSYISMGFGTFDGLHLGHISFLKQLKALGGYLIIVIARDETVLKVKNKKTIFSELDRLRFVKDTGLANEVILGDKKDYYKVIREHKISRIGFGYDQKINIEKIREINSDIEFFKLKAFYPKKYKSSILNNKYK